MSLTPEIIGDLVDQLGEKHIMLSYNWGVQDLVRTTYEYIESLGVPVWMDIKGGVSGNINAAMAKGVEGALLICPFMTEDYENSESCELELNYAKDRKVQIVPCMVQQQSKDGSQYRASGWLGVITAGKLWTDFRNVSDDGPMIAKQADQLLMEIANKLNVDTRGGFKPVKPPPKAAAPKAAAPAPPVASPPKGGSRQRALGSAWENVSGALTAASTGNSGIWGVNKHDSIYNWNGQSWTQISGQLVHVSSGASVWGVNRGDCIYKYLGNNQWHQTSGRLTNVDVSNGDNVWGVNRGEDIYRRTGESWQHIPGKAIQVSVGESGVWVVNSGHNIYYRVGTFGDIDTDGSDWVLVEGKLKWVASGPGKPTEKATAAPKGLKNLALKRTTVYQSSTSHNGNPQRAVDGNTDGVWSHNGVTHTDCNKDKYLAWWHVNLGGWYKIQTVRIWNRVECSERLDKAHVYLHKKFTGSVNFKKGQRWYEFSGDDYNTNSVTVSLISKNPILSLAQVEVFGTGENGPTLTNVAEKKPCYQSSIAYGGDPNRAVNGNTDNFYQSCNTTHTDSKKDGQRAWWYVELGARFRINEINILDRAECPERINEALIYVDDELVHKINYTAGIWWYHAPVTGVKYGSRIGITLNTGQPLSVCEVLVMSDGTIQ